MKTKKELIEELDKCHKLIEFYLGRNYDVLTREELLERLEKGKKLNDTLTKIIWFMTMFLFCAVSFILGLMW